MILYFIYFFIVCISNVYGMLIESPHFSNNMSHQVLPHDLQLVASKKPSNDDWYTVIKKKAIKDYNFFAHASPDPDTFTMGRFVYHIPALADLIDIKRARGADLKNIYDLTKIVLLGIDLKPQLKDIYEYRALKTLKDLSKEGYIPALLDVLAMKTDFSERDLQKIEAIQDYIYEHPEYDEYDKNKYSQLITRIEFNKDTALVRYLCARSYATGIGNMLSQEKAFDIYLDSFEQADEIVKEKIIYQSYGLAINNLDRMNKLLDKLVDEKNEEFQFIACELFAKMFSFEEAKKITIENLKKITEFTCQHYIIDIVKALIHQINGEVFSDNNDFAKAIQSYEETLVYLKSPRLHNNEQINRWTRTTQNKLASLYIDTYHINKAVELFKINADNGDEYAKHMIATLYINSCWKNGKIVEKNERIGQNFDPIPKKLFEQAITYLTELAEKKAEIAGLLAKLYLGPKYNQRNCLRNICDWHKAFHYAQLAEQAGDHHYGLYTLFILHKQGIPTVLKPNKEKALSFLIKGGNFKNSLFINSLIKQYDDDNEYEKAVEWIKKALKQTNESHKKNYFALAYLAYYYSLGITQKSGYKPSLKDENIIVSAQVFKEALENLIDTKLSQEELEIFSQLQSFLNSKYIEYATNNPQSEIISLLSSMQEIKLKHVLLIRK